MPRSRRVVGVLCLAVSLAALPSCASDSRSATTATAQGTSRATAHTSAPRSEGATAPNTTPATPSSTSGHAHGTAGTVTVAVTGDVLPHASVLRDAAANAGGHGWDFTPMFAAVAPIIRHADIGICQLETTVSTTDTGLTTANTFVSPHELVGDLVTAGFDGCSFANNHAMDAGLQGIRQTRAAAAHGHLKLAGPGADAETTNAPAVYTGGGLRVAQLSYSYTVDNAIEHDTSTPPNGAPWLRRSLYPARTPSGIVADAHDARAAGADIVLVSMHWGNMFESAPTAEQQRYARALLRSGQIDAIIGAHPHVVQPCRKIDGRYVLYSVGNFLSAQGPAAGLPAASQDGVIATMTFRRDRDGTVHESLHYTPTEVTSGHRVRASSKGSTSYRRTVAAMTSLGRACPATASD